MSETRSSEVKPGGDGEAARTRRPPAPTPLGRERNEYDDEAEPLSLAEELAEEGFDPETSAQYENVKQGDIHIAELQRMGMPQLIELARAENVNDILGIKKQDLIFKI